MSPQWLHITSISYSDTTATTASYRTGSPTARGIVLRVGERTCTGVEIDPTRIARGQRHPPIGQQRRRHGRRTRQIIRGTQRPALSLRATNLSEQIGRQTNDPFNTIAGADGRVFGFIDGAMR
jgi:hypothetical protein